MTDIMSLFAVTATLHAECAACHEEARNAAIHARVTGSVGASSETVHDGTVLHSATVTRRKDA